MKKNTMWSDLYMGLILLFLYLPIFFVILYSFNGARTTAVWGGFSLQWYKELFGDRDLLDALVNSLVLGVISCITAAVIGTLGAVGMAKSHLKTKGIVEYVARLPIMIPEIILGMVFLAFFSFLHLPFGMVTLVIAHTAFCVPYILMTVKARLAGMDPCLEEAARDLGASSVRAFLDILFPLLLPGIMSGSLLAFAMSLDDIVISIFVNAPKVNTLPIKIYTQMKFGVTPKINALCTLMLGAVLFVLAIRAIGKKLKDHGM